MVSAYFDLTKMEDRTSAIRTSEWYESKSRSVLGAKVRMILYGDAESVKWMRKMREMWAPGVETEYVERDLMDYEWVRMAFPIVKRNRMRSARYMDPNERNTSSAYMAYVFKMWALADAARRAPRSSHVGWVDVGCGHVLRGDVTGRLERLVESPKPKIAVTYIHYRGTEWLKDQKKRMEYGGWCGVAGGLITVESGLVDLMQSRFWSVFWEMIGNGVGHGEEQILTYMVDRWPEMFELRYGDYYSLLSNYEGVTEDVPSIRRWFCMEALRSNRICVAKAAASEVMRSVADRKLVLDSRNEDFFAMVSEL